MVRNFWLRKQLATIETNLCCNSKYKPGEIARTIMNALSNRVTKAGQDPEGLGRLSITTMEG